jgi:alkylation response protein AidB-like acyl-CoA dehydrogenase
MANFYSDNKDLKFHLEHPMMKKLIGLKEKNYEDKDKYDYAPLDFEDALDSYEKVLEIIGDISANIIGPNAEAIDHEGHKIVDNHVVYAKETLQNHEALTHAGLIGFMFPRKYDGLNFSLVAYMIACELISRADAGFANIWGLQDCGETIHEFGNEEIKNEFLPRFNKGATAAMSLTEPDAGSDLQVVQLKATYDEQKEVWLLNGVKRFITNGDADISLVLARSEEGTNDARGLSLYVYDKNHNAVTVRRIENKLGIKGSPTAELVFTNAPAKLLGDRKLGLIKYVMSLMNSARLGIGAQSVGLAEAAYREALKYAMERVQFGKSIINFPAVYEMLTRMKVNLQAMRSFLYETARFIDIYKSYNYLAEDRKLKTEERHEMKKYQRLADVFTPMLKLYNSEMCNSIAYDSMQIHGGAGFMKDFPIERIYRDSRITTIYEGTSQLQVVAAIRGVLTGAYLEQIKVYAEERLAANLEFLKPLLIEMTEEYEQAIRLVLSRNDNEYVDFHARRLVEMACNIILGFLLLNDANRNSDYLPSAEIFIKFGFTQNKQKLSYIKGTEPRDMGYFKLV